MMNRANWEDTSKTFNDEWVDAPTTSGSQKDVKCQMLIPDKLEVTFKVETESSVNVLLQRYHPPNL